MEYNASTYINYAISAFKYNVIWQCCTCFGEIALRQSKLLPSDVTIGYFSI